MSCSDNEENTEAMQKHVKFIEALANMSIRDPPPEVEESLGSIDYDDSSGEDDSDRYDDDEDYPREPEQEPVEDYAAGGYHPVSLGDVFDSRYYTLRKLGWGHFGTVWLAFDTQYNIYAAIKIPKSDSNFSEASEDEHQILRALRKANAKNHEGSQNICQLLNFFYFYGMDNALHGCMVFEVLGENLLTLLNKFKNLNLNFIKVISKHLLQGLSFLHDSQIIHTDIKPENVVIALTQNQVHQIALEAFKYHSDKIKDKPKHMVSSASEAFRNEYIMSFSESCRKKMRKLRKRHREKYERFLKTVNKKDSKSIKESFSVDDSDPLSSYYEQLQAGNLTLLKQCKVKIVDFGNACFIDEKYGDNIQTREYRSPEVIVGCDYDTSADIWSAACLIFEIASGEYLFYPHKHDEDLYDSDEDHLSKICEIAGPFSREIYQSGSRFRQFFDEDGTLLKFPEITTLDLASLIMDVAKYKEADAEELAAFLKPMLNLNQHERAKAETLLESTWLKLKEDPVLPPRRRSATE